MPAMSMAQLHAYACGCGSRGTWAGLPPPGGVGLLTRHTGCMQCVGATSGALRPAGHAGAPCTRRRAGAPWRWRCAAGPRQASEPPRTAAGLCWCPPAADRQTQAQGQGRARGWSKREEGPRMEGAGGWGSAPGEVKYAPGAGGLGWLGLGRGDSWMQRGRLPQVCKQVVH